MNFIRSLIANHHYRKSFHYMGVSSPLMALDSIRKASKWEPNRKYLPRYLCLQAELEIGFGEQNKALLTIKDAKTLINENKEFWYSGSHNDIIKKIDDAFTELTKKTT